MKKPLLSVIIPTHNRCEFVIDCVQSLLRQEFEDEMMEVIVVDDGSSDGTYEVIHKVVKSPNRFPVIPVRQEHRGGNAARNRGIHFARGEIVAICDDDTIIPPHWARVIVSLFEKYPEIDGVGGPLLPWGELKMRVCERCRKSFYYRKKEVEGLTDWLYGGNMAFRREVFKSVGLFDESLVSFQEVEWFERAKALSCKFYYSEDAWVYHRIDQYRFIPWMMREFDRGRGLVDILERRRRSYSHVATFVRLVGHAVRRQCLRGIVYAAREIGYWYEKFQRWNLGHGHRLN